MDYMKNYILNGMRLFCLCLLALLAVQADGDQVVVIYNSRVPASKTVAEHYAAARHVPARTDLRFRIDHQ